LQEVRVLTSRNWRPVASLEHGPLIQDENIVAYNEKDEEGEQPELPGNSRCRYVVMDVPFKLNSIKQPVEKPNPRIGICELPLVSSLVSGVVLCLAPILVTTILINVSLKHTQAPDPPSPPLVLGLERYMHAVSINSAWAFEREKSEFAGGHRSGDIECLREAGIEVGSLSASVCSCISELNGLLHVR
jgi:hypothetical protein